MYYTTEQCYNTGQNGLSKSQTNFNSYKAFHKIQHYFKEQDKQTNKKIPLNKLSIEGIYQPEKVHPTLLHHRNH